MTIGELEDLAAETGDKTVLEYMAYRNECFKKNRPRYNSYRKTMFDYDLDTSWIDPYKFQVVADKMIADGQYRLLPALIKQTRQNIKLGSYTACNFIPDDETAAELEELIKEAQACYKIAIQDYGY